MCHEQRPDVHHRHLPEVLVPHGDTDGPPDPERPAVTWALEQDDEVDAHDVLVAHAPVVALRVGPSGVRLSLDEAAVLGAQLLSLTASARVGSRGRTTRVAGVAFVPQRLARDNVTALVNWSVED